MASSKAAPQQQGKKKVPGIPFKANDPETGEKDERINRKGRLPPKDLVELKDIIDEIFNETIRDSSSGKEMDKLSVALNRLLFSKSPAGAIHILDRRFGKVPQAIEMSNTGGASGSRIASLPAELIAPDFLNVYRDIKAGLHSEYAMDGGRGSTKSSFISLVAPILMADNPDVHMLALRQVKDTLKQSVYSQLVWAISELGLSDQFKCTESPLEIVYLPTGQTIYFRGADDPTKIKSIKPPFGYIGILWFEEFDQFRGEEQLRNIVQSSLRGGDRAWRFESWNTPRTKNHWVHKYIAVPKPDRYYHHSTYLNVPREWTGKIFLDEAEHLKSVNFPAYEHEYLGIANNIGGAVFTNVRIEPILDEQIAQFDQIHEGLDWGYYPDPASYGKMHYDAARRTLYIFGEGRYWKKSNEDLFKQLISDGLIRKVEYKEGKKITVSYPDLIIADSAEPKSVGDFRAYGANCRGAEKGPESVKYSIKWLQGLTSIVIDNTRAPYHAEEFLNYEYERTKDGEIISEYPDKNNHAIDDTRYATNLIWRRRGE
jgi:phage terminase large subunit